MRRMETKAKVTGGGGDKKSLQMCYTHCKRRGRRRKVVLSMHVCARACVYVLECVAIRPGHKADIGLSVKTGKWPGSIDY